MKFIAAIVFSLLILSVHAQPAPSDSQEVLKIYVDAIMAGKVQGVDYQRASLGEITDAMTKKTGMPTSFQNEKARATRVTVKSEETTFGDMLDTALSQCGMTWEYAHVAGKQGIQIVQQEDGSTEEQIAGLRKYLMSCPSGERAKEEYAAIYCKAAFLSRSISKSDRTGNLDLKSIPTPASFSFMMFADSSRARKQRAESDLVSFQKADNPKTPASDDPVIQALPGAVAGLLNAEIEELDWDIKFADAAANKIEWKS